MFTNRNGNGFFATEFKRISSSESEYKIHITRQEIKDILNEYDSIKTAGCLHPVSGGIKSIKALYEHLSKDIYLTDDELLELAKILIKLKNTIGSKTHSVVKGLLDKLKLPIRFIEKYNLYFPIKETFPIVCQKPTIVEDIEIIIKHCGCRDMLKNLIIHYPNALSIISKSINTKKFSSDLLTQQFWPMIFDHNKQEYAIDIALAFEDMRLMDRILYHQVDSTVTNEEAKESITKPYKATLCSEKNMQVILKHGEFAADIAWIYIALHNGRIGKDNLRNAEDILGSVIDKDSSCANQLRHAFEKLHENKLFDASHVSYLLSICKNANVSEKLTSAFVALHNNQILNQDNFNFILNNIQVSAELVLIMQWLKLSFLFETPGIQNVLYQYAPKIDMNVVSIIQKLYETRLLNKNNFFAVFENHLYLKALTSELTDLVAQEQFDAIILKIKPKPVAEEKPAIELKEEKSSNVLSKVELTDKPVAKVVSPKLNETELKPQESLAVFNTPVKEIEQKEKSNDELYTRLRRI